MRSHILLPGSLHSTAALDIWVGFPGSFCSPNSSVLEFASSVPSFLVVVSSPVRVSFFLLCEVSPTCCSPKAVVSCGQLWSGQLLPGVSPHCHEDFPLSTGDLSQQSLNRSRSPEPVQ